MNELRSSWSLLIEKQRTEAGAVRLLELQHMLSHIETCANCSARSSWAITLPTLRRMIDEAIGRWLPIFRLVTNIEGPVSCLDCWIRTIHKRDLHTMDLCHNIADRTSAHVEEFVEVFTEISFCEKCRFKDGSPKWIIFVAPKSIFRKWVLSMILSFAISSLYRYTLHQIME